MFEQCWRWWRWLTLQNPGDINSKDKTGFGRIFSQLAKRKPLRDIVDEKNKNELSRLLGFFALNTLGLGAIIGAGIFTVVGYAAANFAGPAEIFALLIGALPAVLAALSYVEMASMIPASGSSYTYIYTVLGEFFAWIVGWDLCLEYMCAAATIAVSWAKYVGSFIELVFQTSIDHRLLSGPIEWNVTSQSFYRTDSWICLPAVVVILFLTAIIVYDVGISTRFNSVIVSAKIIILIIFICVGIKYINPKNYSPILPNSQGGNIYGGYGLFHATSISFFSFIGFDAITTAAQEATNEAAKRLPLSILTTLGIATILYLGVASVMLGVVNYADLKGENPIGEVCKVIGMKWLEVLVNLAAVFGLTSVMLVSLYGQSRIFYSMSKDGLLTPAFSKTSFRKRKSVVNSTAFSSTKTTTSSIVNTIGGVETIIGINAATEKTNKQTGSPVWACIVIGGFCSVAAGFLPINFLAETTSIGTLFAYGMVHVSVIVMHWTHKPKENVDASSILSDFSEAEANEYINTRYSFPSRTLICPILGILTCLLLIGFTTKWTILRFVCWNLVIGQAVYWLYSRKHSILGNKPPVNPRTIDPTNACSNTLSQGQPHPHDDTTITSVPQTIIVNRATSSVRPAEMIEAHQNITTLRL